MQETNEPPHKCKLSQDQISFLGTPAKILHVCQPHSQHLMCYHRPSMATAQIAFWSLSAACIMFSFSVIPCITLFSCPFSPLRFHGCLRISTFAHHTGLDASRVATLWFASARFCPFSCMISNSAACPLSLPHSPCCDASKKVRQGERANALV